MGKGWAGEGGRLGKRSGNKDYWVKKQMEEDGKLGYLLKSTFIFSNIRTFLSGWFGLPGGLGLTCKLNCSRGKLLFVPEKNSLGRCRVPCTTA